MAEYISREEVLDKSEYTGNFNLVVPVRLIKAIPAANVQLVVETEDLATATEQFICKNCGIRIENFDKVVLEEDNDGYIDKLFCEYIFKYCPECGAKVREAENGIRLYFVIDNILYISCGYGNQHNSRRL